MSEQGKRIRRIAIILGVIIIVIVIATLAGPSLFNLLLEMHGLA